MVGGAIAAHPLGGGGNAWAFLQYVLGLRQLGIDAYYVEEIDGARCIDADWAAAPFATSANAGYFSAVIERFGLQGRAALFDTSGGGALGLTARDVDLLARDTDLFINLSGRFHRREVLAAVHRRMYVDLDPGFVQIWAEQYHVDMNLAGHDVYVSVGLNLGAADCPLPTCGIDWHTSLPPVVLSEWGDALSATANSEPRTPSPDPEHGAEAAYTTVADWRGYSPVEWRGVWYGQKSEEFLKIIDLPKRVSAPLELCLAIHPNEPDLPKLLANGWRLVSPREMVETPDEYRAYVRGSRGEVTAVKNGYAVGRSGWFSDRSACYLAAGRPVIVQDTGLGKHLPVGEGLLTFTDVASAAAAISRVEAAYPHHAAAARSFATQYLDSARVLDRLVWLGS